MHDIFVAKLRENRFANSSSIRSGTQFVSGHAGYLNELYMPAVLLSFSFHSAPHHKLFTTTFRGQMCDDILHQCPSQYIWWWLLPRPSDICFVLVRISSGVVGHGFSGLALTRRGPGPSCLPALTHSSFVNPWFPFLFLNGSMPTSPPLRQPLHFDAESNLVASSVVPFTLRCHAVFVRPSSRARYEVAKVRNFRRHYYRHLWVRTPIHYSWDVLVKL